MLVEVLQALALVDLEERTTTLVLQTLGFSLTDLQVLHQLLDRPVEILLLFLGVSTSVVTTGSLLEGLQIIHVLLATLDERPDLLHELQPSLLGSAVICTISSLAGGCLLSRRLFSCFFAVEALVDQILLAVLLALFLAVTLSPILVATRFLAVSLGFRLLAFLH